MPDQDFGSLLSFHDVEQKVLAHYKLWMHTWLCARERKVNLPINTIARPRSYIVKQTFTALPGEEQTPIVIAVSNGFAAEPARHGSGDYDALLRFGIAAVCMAVENSTRELAGHYQAVLAGIAIRHRGIDDGSIRLEDFVDMRVEDIEEEQTGRSMSAVRLELVYKVNDFVSERPALLEPPIDPEPPQPDDPPVETVHVDVNNYKVDEEIPSGL